MKTQLTGTRNGVRWPVAGTVVEVPPGEAVDLISSGLAEAVVDEKPEPRKATAKKAEKRA